MPAPMRAHGIRSYHWPGRLEEALALAAQGAMPVGGGTRIFAAHPPRSSGADLVPVRELPARPETLLAPAWRASP